MIEQSHLLGYIPRRNKISVSRASFLSVSHLSTVHNREEVNPYSRLLMLPSQRASWYTEGWRKSVSLLHLTAFWSPDLV